MDSSQQTESVRRTLQIYRDLEKERDEQKAERARAIAAGEIDPEEPVITERLRATRRSRSEST